MFLFTMQIYNKKWKHKKQFHKYVMGYVYLIYDKNNNSYKIGVTKGDTNKRLKKLQTGNSCELEIKNLFCCDLICHFVKHFVA